VGEVIDRDVTSGSYSDRLTTHFVVLFVSIHVANMFSTSWYARSDRLIAHFGLLPIGVGKCQHLPKWFGKSPKWKRSQAFFGLLPPHSGTC